MQRRFKQAGAVAMALSGWLFSGAVAWSADYTLGVSEGASDGLNHSAALARYEPLAEVIGQSLGGKVTVVYVREFKALSEGIEAGRFDFVAVRPSNLAARGMRDHGYRYVASAKPEAACQIIAGPKVKIAEAAQLKGKKWVMPEAQAFASLMCKAELRDLGVDLSKENVTYVREQGAVPFNLEYGFQEVGALGSNSLIARKWLQDGKPVVHTSKSFPAFPLIAHQRISTAQVAAVQKTMQELNGHEAGRKLLRSYGIQQVDVGGEKRLLDMLEWLKP